MIEIGQSLVGGILIGFILGAVATLFYIGRHFRCLDASKWQACDWEVFPPGEEKRPKPIAYRKKGCPSSRHV